VELVFGVLADKDHAAMLAALAPAVRRFHLVAPPSPRARSPVELRVLAEASGVVAHAHTSLPDALACARRAAEDGAIACVAGSLYLVGEARALLVA
jgi:dihydrofolate synthase/folylpolyglutamate synthase